MSTQSLGKVGLTRNAFNSEQDKIDHLQLSNGDPNGVISSFVGSLCLDINNIAIYQNDDGCTSWKLLLSGDLDTLINNGVFPFKVTYTNLVEPFIEMWDMVNSGPTFTVALNSFPVFKYTYVREGATRVRTYLFNGKGAGTYGSGEEPTVANDYILLFSSDPDDQTLRPDNISLDGMGGYFLTDDLPHRLDDGFGHTQETFNRVVEEKLQTLESAIDGISQGAVGVEVESITASVILSTPSESCSFQLDSGGDIVTHILVNSIFLDSHLFDPMSIFLADPESANTIHCMVTNESDSSKAFFKVVSVEDLSGYYKLTLQIDDQNNSETFRISNTSITVGDSIFFQFYPGEKGSGSGGSSFQGIIGYWIDGRPIYRTVIPFNNTTIDNDSYLNHNLDVDIYIKESYLIPGLGRIVPSYQTPGDLLSTGYVSTYVPTQNRIRLDFVASDAYTSGKTWYYLVEHVKGGGVVVDTEPPTPPILSFNTVGHTTVNLTWTGADDNIGVYSYKVYQDTVLVFSDVSIEELQIIGLTPSTGYNFYVVAVDEAGNESVPSNTVTVNTIADPGSGDVTNPTAPTLALDSLTDSEVNLSWSGATDNIAVTGYNLYQDTILIFSFPVTTESFSVQALTSSTSYDFVITAVDAAGNESVDSNTITALTLGQDTQAPTAPVLATGLITQNSVGLSWSAGTDDVGVVSYNLYKGGSFLINTSSLNFTASGLTPSTLYSFSVRALDAAGNESVDSNIVTPTTSSAVGPSPTTHTVDNNTINQDIDSGVSVGIVITDSHVTNNYFNSEGYTPTTLKIVTLPTVGEFLLDGNPIIGDEIALSLLALNQLVWYPQNQDLSNLPPHPYSENITFKIKDDQGYLTNTATLNISGSDIAQVPADLLRIGGDNEILTTTLTYKDIPETVGVELEIAEDVGFSVGLVSLPMTMGVTLAQGEEYVSVLGAEASAIKNDLSFDTTYYARIKRSVGVYTNIVTFKTAKQGVLYMYYSLIPDTGGYNVHVSRSTPVGDYPKKDFFSVEEPGGGSIASMTSFDWTYPPGLGNESEYNLRLPGAVSRYVFTTYPSFANPLEITTIQIRYENSEPDYLDWLPLDVTRVCRFFSNSAIEKRGTEWVEGVSSFTEAFHEEGASLQTSLKYIARTNDVLEEYDNATLKISHYYHVSSISDDVFANVDFSAGDVTKEFIVTHTPTQFHRIREVEISQLGLPTITIAYSFLDSVAYVSGNLLN